MSTKVSKTKFLEFLKSLIRKEIEEASTTVSAGGGVGKGIYYDTPYAFAGKDKKTGKKKDRRDDIANKSGYTKVEGKSPIFKYQGPVHKNSREAMKWASTQNFKKDYGVVKVKGGHKIIVQEGKYHQYRNDESLTPKQKIGRSMREVRNSLTELSRLIDMNVRLKKELNVSSGSYWKNTHKALHKISERLVKLANKVGQLQ